MPIELPAYAWVWIAVLGTAAVYAILRTVTGNIRFEVEVHDLQVRVRRLHEEYARRVRVLNGEEEEEVGAVDILDDDGNVIEQGEPVPVAEGIELPDDAPVPQAA